MKRNMLKLTMLLFIFIAVPTCCFATDIERVVPAAGETDVPLDTAINFWFSGNMSWCEDSSTGLDAVALTFDSPGHTVVIHGTEASYTQCEPDIVLGIMGRLAFKLDDPENVLRPGVTYTITLSGAVDYQGQSVSGEIVPDPDGSGGYVTSYLTTSTTGPPVLISPFPNLKSFGSVVLDAGERFFDPDGGELTYGWNYFLRGLVVGGGGSASGPVVTLQDLIPGFYDVFVYATDQEGKSAEATFVLLVDIGHVGDLNGDGVIDGLDLILFAGAFGQ